MDEWAISSCHFIRLITGRPTETSMDSPPNSMDEELEEKLKLTAFIRSGDREGTKVHQEKGRRISICEAEATKILDFLAGVLVRGSRPKRGATQKIR